MQESMTTQRWMWAKLLGMILLMTAQTVAEEAAAPCIHSDGRLLDESFDAPAMPEGWTTPAGRRDVSFKDGLCIFNDGHGDNFVQLPALKFDPAETLVLELVLRIPKLTEGGYTVLILHRSEGDIQVTLQVAAEGNRVLVGGKQVGSLRPGAAHTLAIACMPDGSYQGILTAAHIEKPYIRTVTGPQGTIKSIQLGNVANTGQGELQIDSVKVGGRTTLN